MKYLHCSSWLGARRRPPHETVFLLFHLNGATARAPFFFFGAFCLSETSFFAFFCCFFCRGVGRKPHFLPFFVFFFVVVLVGGVGCGGGVVGGVGGGGGGLITFFRLEHIWDNTS